VERQPSQSGYSDIEKTLGRGDNYRCSDRGIPGMVHSRLDKHGGLIVFRSPEVKAIPIDSKENKCF